MSCLAKNLGCQYYAKLRLSSCPWPQCSQTGPYSEQVLQLRFFNDFGWIDDFLKVFAGCLTVLRGGCLFAPHADSCAKLTRHQSCNRGCCFCSAMFCIALVQ